VAMTTTTTTTTTTSSRNKITIDFDVPRYGPLCVSIDGGDVLEFVWDEYHNLHELPDEDSYDGCDFSDAVVLAYAAPNPSGTIVETGDGDGDVDVDDNRYNNRYSERYFSCSKICRRNRHKVRVCVGGGAKNEPNGCNTNATECTKSRTFDMRSPLSAPLSSEQPEKYVASGTVCRPKNGDGYAIYRGVDTPESCSERCENDKERCGAWEFENYGFDDRECELHEKSVVSFSETNATGDCVIPSNEDEGDGDGEGGDGIWGYRCCWISKDVVDEQLGAAAVVAAVATASDADAVAYSSSSSSVSSSSSSSGLASALAALFNIGF